MSLSKEAINKIALSKNKNHAISIVREKVTANYKIRSDLWRHEIYLEVLVDLVDFCLKKGFSLDQCVKCSQFMENCLNLMKKPSSKLTSLVDYLTENLKKLPPAVDDYYLKEFIGYLNTTILTHFNLFKYVFCFDRDDNTIVEKKAFYSPKESQDEVGTNIAKPYNVWLYDEKLNAFDSKENEIKKKYGDQREKMLIEEQNAINLINFIKNDAYGQEKPLDEKTMKQLLNEISGPIFKATKQILKCDLDEAKERVENSRQRNTLIMAESEAQMKAKESMSITPKGKGKK